MEKTKSSTKSKTPNTTPKRLVRSNTDKFVAGVCGGIANYFEIDSIIVRIVFLLITFSGGAGVLIYVILWVIMPEVGDEKLSNEEVAEKNSKQLEKKFEEVVENIDTKNGKNIAQAIFGILILFFGIYLLLNNFGLGHYLSVFWNLGRFWPVLVIFFGFYILFKKNEQ